MDEAVSLRALRAADAAGVAALVRRAFALQSAPIDPPASALRLTEADVLAHLRGGGVPEDAGRQGAGLRERDAGEAAETECAACLGSSTGSDARNGVARPAGTLGAASSAGGAVAVIQDLLVGSVMWSERDGGLYVERLAVAPTHRRRGIARALVAAAEQAARGGGIASLHLGTRLTLLDNRRLFTGCGFIETSRHAHPGFAEPTWVRMEKALA